MAVVMLYACQYSANSASRRLMARSKSFVAMASATSWVCFTASNRGLRSILFSTMQMTGLGVSGVASSTAFTASAPCRVESIRSYAQAVPPRWTWPRVVILVSRRNFSVRRFLTWDGEILCRFRSWAPSATITMVLRFPRSRCCAG